MQNFLIESKERFVVFLGNYDNKFIPDLIERIQRPIALFIAEDENITASADFEKIMSANQYFNTEYSQKDGIILDETWNTRTLIDSLEKRGLVYNVDFCFYRDFIFQYDLIHFNLCRVFYTEMILTFKCSLRCRDCTYHIPYLPKNQDRSLPEILQDLDLYFAAVDEVSIFRLLGGEPLLHPNLNSIISHIGKNYRNQIGELFLVTNGTIKPTDEIIRLMQEYNVKMVLSDYSKNVPNLKKSITALRKFIKSQGIKLQVMVGDWWNDDGGINYQNKLTDEGLKNLFHKCEAFCRVLHNGKLYYCGKSIIFTQEGRMLETDMRENVEYVALDDKSNLKSDIIKMNIGQQTGAYANACKFCKGYFGPFCGEKLPSGIQLKEQNNAN